VQEAERLSLEEIGRLLEASEGIRFAGVKRAQVYSWIELVVCEQEYARQGKASRGLLRRYIEKITGKSRAHALRLIISIQFSNPKRSLPQLPIPPTFRLILQLEKTEGRRISLVTMTGAFSRSKECMREPRENTAGPSTTLRFGRDDKGRRGGPSWSGCGRIHPVALPRKALREPQGALQIPPVGRDDKGRGAAQAGVVAGGFIRWR
jgi:hypothetical protein